MSELAIRLFLGVAVRAGALAVLYLSWLCAQAVSLLYATYGIDVATCTAAVVMLVTFGTGSALLIAGLHPFRRVEMSRRR